MAQEFIARKGIISLDGAQVTGSLSVTGNISASIFTGSFRGDGSQLTGVAGAATASYVEYTNVANKPALVSGSSQISFNGIVDKPTLVSGSSQVTYSGLSGIPVGIVSGSSQVSFTGIVDKPTLVSGSSQVTYGELSGIPVGIVSSSTQITGYNIFATTGSNQFNGSQSITGSLTVTGQVVAQTLNVQQVTSSIVFSSGSNIFGNSLSNTQQFTGSVSVTGSLISTSGLQITANNNALGTNNTLRFTDTDTATEANQQIGKIEFFSSDTSTPGAGVKAYIGAFAQDSTPDAYIAFATQDGSGTPDPVERLRISSEGNVGIGGTPSRKLDVIITDNTTYSATSDNANSLNLFNTSTTNNTFSSIRLGSQGAGSAGIVTLYGAQTTDAAGSGFFAIGTRNAGSFGERFRITSDGNVGIGTASPNYLLHIAAGAANPQLQFTSTGTGNTTSDGFHIGVNNSTLNAFLLQKENAALQFLTNDTERMRLDASGSLGLGVTPSAWASDFRAMQIGLGTSLYNNSNTNGTFLGSNFFFNGSNNIYLGTGTATAYGQSLGTHAWYNALSGTAGCAISFTQAMTLDASGNLLIGATSNISSTRRELVMRGANGSVVSLGNNTTADRFQIASDSGENALLNNKANTPMIFYTNNAEVMRILSGGNVGIGVSSPDIFSRGDERMIGMGAACASDNLALALNAGGSAGRGSQIYMGQGGTRHLTISSNATETRVGTTTSTPLILTTNDTTRLTIASTGAACFACELTAKSLGTNDLILNNLNHDYANYVDGTRGSWLIQEGACDLFIINQVSCKKYKFNLIEIK